MFIYVDKNGTVSMRSDGRLTVDKTKFTEVEIAPTQEQLDSLASNLKASYAGTALTFAPKDDKASKLASSFAKIRSDLAKNNPNIVDVIGRLMDAIEAQA